MGTGKGQGEIISVSRVGLGMLRSVSVSVSVTPGENGSLAVWSMNGYQKSLGGETGLGTTQSGHGEWDPAQAPSPMAGVQTLSPV